MFQSELKAIARNLIAAKPGQKVIIESKSSRIFGAAILVYVMPLVFFLLGYAAAALAGAGEGIRILVSFAALLVSAVVLVLSQRMKNKQKPITFDIIG
jgi:positive regulator of sigma E activity